MIKRKLKKRPQKLRRKMFKRIKKVKMFKRIKKVKMSQIRMNKQIK